jgi:hypothetical protein
MADYLTGILNALKLPARIIAGMFLFSLLVLAFDYFALINLPELHPLARAIVIIAALGFGALSLAALLGVIYDAYTQRHKRTLLAARRELRRAEAKQAIAEYQARVLKRLDYLSVGEIRYVADCLRRNEQSFLTYAYSGAVSNLMVKGLADSPRGTHDQDHCPFYFFDFVWEELLARKDAFIAKDDENQRREAAEKERALRRR